MRKAGTVFLLLGLLLIVAAIGLIGYNLWEQKQASLSTDTVLEELLPALHEKAEERYKEQQEANIDTAASEKEYPDYVLNPNMDMPVQTVDGKEYIGILTIPSLDMELPVMKQWDYSNLRMAPCCYNGTAYRAGFVICAHNYNCHFGSLRQLNAGEKVQFIDVDGNVFTYKVVATEILKPSAEIEMKELSWDLSLFTCTVGGASRVTVRCERLTDESARIPLV